MSNLLKPCMLGLAVGALALTVTSRAYDWPILKTSSKAPVIVSDSPLSRDSKFNTSFSSIVKKAAPSVVNISTTKTIKRDPRFDYFQNDPFFRRFFGDPNGRGGRMAPQKQSSLGSGVIVTSDGYILTNNHVVDGADEIKILLAKGKKEYDGKIVGRDPRSDIAVVKIEASDLPAATLADSDKVEVGDVALAIGSPFGLSQTVTMGIVSAVGRGGMNIEEYEDFIQTDAAINPGNSGGALIDAEGRVIGINTAILSSSGGSVGVGFAVPVNQARGIMDQLIKDGKVQRGFLGVGIQDVTGPLAKHFDVPEGKGALISDVTAKSAAEAAGLKQGDVIVAVNGKEVADSRQLRLIVGQIAPGTTVKVKYVRDGKESTAEVKLKEKPDTADGDVEKAAGDSGEDALDGVAVSDINDEARAQLRLPENLKGAVIMEVDPSSPAYEAGLRAGDVIQEINQKPIRNADDAVKATQNVKNKQLVLRVYTRGASRFVVVDESKKK
jgi:serine protease Do